MSLKPCETDLLSEDHETWGKAIGKCSSGAPWECIERKVCVNDGICFINPWADPEKAQERIAELEEEISTLKVRETLMVSRLKGNLLMMTDKYQSALKTGNQPMVWATEFVKREIKEIMIDLELI
jgi:hypothetical protein